MTVYCSTHKDLASLESFSFNGKKIAVSSPDYRDHNQTIYLSGSILREHMNLELKELMPGELISVCTDELCINFGLNKDDKNSAFKEGETFFIPVEMLISELGGTVVWEPDKNNLQIKLSH